jgi:hypothetical protein
MGLKLPGGWKVEPVKAAKEGIVMHECPVCGKIKSRPFTCDCQDKKSK